MFDPKTPKATEDEQFAGKIGAHADRKLESKRHPQGVWFGLGMMGLVGWTVAVPTVLGAAVGIWLDDRHPGAHPWTLALLVAGLVLGCMHAGYWVAKEDRAMHRKNGGTQ